MKLSELLEYPRVESSTECDDLVLSKFETPEISNPEVQDVISRLIDASTPNQVMLAFNLLYDMYLVGDLTIDIEACGDGDILDRMYT